MLIQGQAPEIYELRDALAESERLAEIGRLSATIAHEIKSPLEALSHALYLIEHDCSPDERTQIYLTIARQELAEALEISGQTLRFTRDSASSVEVDVNSALGEILKFYDHKIRYKQVTVVTDFRENVKICASPGKVRQIFSNLVINALEAVAPESGRIFIRCRGRLNRGAPGVQVIIADNGPGLSHAVKHKLFQPFITTKGKGTGLGLWLTQALVEKHGGTIGLRSSCMSKLHGVCVRVCLPQNSQQQIATAA
jgi:signal transduction histidine kinase